MAYQVTKQIGKNRYRYEVEGHRDPATKRVRQRWTYLGRVDGDGVVETSRQRPDGSRERIVAAILQLLERRDVELLTVEVIARAARTSRGTFYRCFEDKPTAVKAAIVSVYTELLAAPLALDEPIATVAVERERLARWTASLVKAILRRPGVHRALARSPQLSRLRLQRAEINNTEVHRSLVRYIERLREAGLVDSASPELLAAGIMCVVQGLFKRLIYDRQERAAAALVESGIDTICRATFGPAA